MKRSPTQRRAPFPTLEPAEPPKQLSALETPTPVVDLDRPGNEVNYDGRRDIAMLADPDPAAMARQIVELLDDAAQLEARRRNGLEYAATFPTEEEIAERVEQLILTRLARRKHNATGDRGHLSIAS